MLQQSLAMQNMSGPSTGNPLEDQLLVLKEELARKDQQINDRENALVHAQEVAKTCMAEAVSRNQEMLSEQNTVHEAQKKYLEDQILWMSAVAGEERMSRAMNDPAFHQETVAQAMAFHKQRRRRASGTAMWCRI